MSYALNAAVFNMLSNPFSPVASVALRAVSSKTFPARSGLKHSLPDILPGIFYLEAEKSCLQGKIYGFHTS